MVNLATFGRDYYHFDYSLSGLKEVESEYYEFTESLDTGLDSVALKEKKDLLKKSEQEKKKKQVVREKFNKCVTN